MCWVQDELRSRAAAQLSSQAGPRCVAFHVLEAAQSVTGAARTPHELLFPHNRLNWEIDKIKINSISSNKN